MLEVVIDSIRGDGIRGLSLEKEIKEESGVLKSKTIIEILKKSGKFLASCKDCSFLIIRVFAGEKEIQTFRFNLNKNQLTELWREGEIISVSC